MSRGDYWLYWILAFAVVVAILAIGAAVQEWWLWRRDRR
jgi:uncharacterized membrane protein YhaH (DUF805 family)